MSKQIGYINNKILYHSKTNGYVVETEWDYTRKTTRREQKYINMIMGGLEKKIK